MEAEAPQILTILPEFPTLPDSTTPGRFGGSGSVYLLITRCQ